MDPEMLRLAQEQMRRMSPGDMATLQQQLMSNPGLMRLASESMRNMSADDVRRAAQQLSQATPADMRALSQKIASATPEELAAMKAQADAQASMSSHAAVSGAKSLKKQGNELHGRGQYADAAAKYKLAMDSLKDAPPSAAAAAAPARALRLQCALNLMACYLKMGSFDECVGEGSEILACDPGNVKAYYRRGQAYKELGKLEAAVADLRKAREIAPEDETIAEVLKDAEEKIGSPQRKLVPSDGGFFPSSSSQTTTVENRDEIVNDQSIFSKDQSMGAQPSSSIASPFTADGMQETVRNFMKDPAMRQMIASMMTSMSPEMMASMSEQFGMKLSKEDAGKAQQAMSSLPLEDLDRMMRWMERARQGVEAAKRTKDWLLGKRGLVLAIVVLILCFVVHQLGIIGG